MATVTRDISINYGTTGRTGNIYVRVIDGDNANLIARTLTGIAESPAGSGQYHLKVTAWDVDWVGRIVWDDAATIIGSENFDAMAAPAAGVVPASGDWSTLTAQQVWEYATRTLSSFGTLVADIVSAITSYLIGSGARTVALTVDDGTDPLEGATVRLSKGAETYIGLTDEDGLVTFTVDDGTWTVAISLYGYTFDNDTLVVADDVSETYSMTLITVSPPAAPGLSTGTLTTLGDHGLPLAEVTITFQQTSLPDDAGLSYEGGEFNVESGTDGVLEYAGFIQGVTYKARRGSGDWVSFTVPTQVSFTLPATLGRP